MKTLITFVALLVLSISGPAFALSDRPYVVTYRMTADGDYPSSTGLKVYPDMFSQCSVNTKFTSGTGSVNVKTKNTDGEFVTLQGGPITATDMKYFVGQFTHILFNMSSCSSCDVTVTLNCGRY